MSKPIVIITHFKTVPKERPDVTSTGTHYSQRYSDFQADAKAALKAAIGYMPAMLTRHFPLSGVKITIEFHGSIRGNGDLDNAGGAWEDAMKQAGIISGDDRNKVNEVNFKFFDRSHPVNVIIIYPNWKPQSEIDPNLLIPPIPITGKAATVKTPGAKTPKHSPSAAVFNKCECRQCKPKDPVKRSSQSAAARKASRDIKK